LPQITIEYMIMIPILIMQIFLFPLTANLIMNVWVDSRRTLVLQETVGHLGSSVQQLYYSLNHNSIADGSVTLKWDGPPFIEGYAYTATATELNSSSYSKIMNITLTLVGANGEASTLVTLGNNAIWQNSTFTSNYKSMTINATKSLDGTIQLSFEGEGYT
jgi:hypothetical protein